MRTCVTVLPAKGFKRYLVKRVVQTWYEVGKKSPWVILRDCCPWCVLSTETWSRFRTPTYSIPPYTHTHTHMSVMFCSLIQTYTCWSLMFLNASPVSHTFFDSSKKVMQASEMVSVRLVVGLALADTLILPSSRRLLVSDLSGMAWY